MSEPAYPYQSVDTPGGNTASTRPTEEGEANQPDGTKPFQTPDSTSPPVTSSLGAPATEEARRIAQRIAELHPPVSVRLFKAPAGDVSAEGAWQSDRCPAWIDEIAQMVATALAARDAVVDALREIAARAPLWEPEGNGWMCVVCGDYGDEQTLVHKDSCPVKIARASLARLEGQG